MAGWARNIHKKRKTSMKVKTFHIAIKAVIVKDDKALIVKDTGRYPGFDLPGGKIDENETINQALKRELFEEIGLIDFKIEELLFVFERSDYKNNNISLMLIFYKVKANDFTVKLSEEHTEYKWISGKEFKEFVVKNEFRNDGVKTALEKVLK